LKNKNVKLNNEEEKRILDSKKRNWSTYYT
jgi:hypothetical protein